MIWAEAEGCRVVDAEGREYIDLSAGFGVAALGHRNPRIAQAWKQAKVVHALGDLAEAASKIGQEFSAASAKGNLQDVAGEFQAFANSVPSEIKADVQTATRHIETLILPP